MGEPKNAAARLALDALTEGLMLRDALAEGLLERYGEAEPALTAMIQGIVEGQGGSMAGLNFRLKSVDSLARKITDDAKTFGFSETIAANRITDVSRYTAIFDTENLFKNAESIRLEMVRNGYELIKIRNLFGKEGNYQGLHFNFKKDGLGFELQFHTQQSFEIKMINHYDYEVNRNINASEELRELTNKWMKKNWLGFNLPASYLSLADWP